jgi:hypothetical protein
MKIILLVGTIVFTAGISKADVDPFKDRSVLEAHFPAIFKGLGAKDKIPEQKRAEYIRSLDVARSELNGFSEISSENRACIEQSIDTYKACISGASRMDEIGVCSIQHLVNKNSNHFQMPLKACCTCKIKAPGFTSPNTVKRLADVEACSGTKFSWANVGPSGNSQLYGNPGDVNFCEQQEKLANRVHNFESAVRAGEKPDPGSDTPVLLERAELRLKEINSHIAAAKRQIAAYKGNKDMAVTYEFQQRTLREKQPQLKPAEDEVKWLQGLIGKSGNSATPTKARGSR